MPRTQYQTCEKILKHLVDLNLKDNILTIGRLKSVIKIIAGSSKNTLIIYGNLMIDFGFIKETESGIFKVVKNE